MKKITYLAAAIAFLGFASLDANAQTDKNKKKSKKKQTVEQTEVQTETEAATENQVNYEEQVQTETQAQTQTQTETQGQNEKREAITQEELPEPVKQTLSAPTFSSWQIVEVFRISPNENARGANAQGTANQSEQAAQNSQANAQANAQGQGARTMYEIFFTNEQEQSAKVRIDEQGNIVRDQK